MEKADMGETPMLREDAFHAEDGHVPVFGDLREKEVKDDDSDEALDKALGAGAADAAGAGAAGEAFVATDQADGTAKEEALEDAFEDLPVVYALGGVLPEGLGGDAEEFNGDEPAAEHAEQVAVDREDREEQKTDEEARDDEVANRVRA